MLYDDFGKKKKKSSPSLLLLIQNCCFFVCHTYTHTVTQKVCVTAVYQLLSSCLMCIYFLAYLFDSSSMHLQEVRNGCLCASECVISHLLVSRKFET